jgi:S-adenosylmethionine:tRNA ribosyltransferase-isomerase
VNLREIEVNDYDYDLPENRIAQFPVKERDLSQLLIHKGDSISKDIFRNITHYVPDNSILVFNNTRVIRARLLFQKDTGASIEILCLEPISPVEYELSLGSSVPVEWKCIVGNLKKWKNKTICHSFTHNGEIHKLTAEKTEQINEAWRIKFTWTCPELSFGQVIEAFGHIPLPPYIKREDNNDDNIRYQTVYSKIRGSVAAPTAGLHFTDHVLSRLREKGIKSAEITLHVGAGTFKPVKEKKIINHEMHCEHFIVTVATIELLLKNTGRIIAVGTTSVRTLESLYWIGVKISEDSLSLQNEFSLGQWEAYKMNNNMSVKDSLQAILNILKNNELPAIHVSTAIIIVPGYDFKIINGIITNFHQPKSTLLLLISAWMGIRWKNIYEYALNNSFRFLSYGDSSLLFR